MKVQAKPEPVKLTMENVSLKFCVQEAYSVKEYQVSGPNWIKNARYDIVATLPPGAAADQVWPAVQTLLAEQLQVSIRRGKKELPIYALTVAKNGPKLHQSGEGGARAPGPGSDESPSGTLRLDNASLAKFCDELSRKTDRPVVDATGIPGTFDFNPRYGRAGDVSGPSVFSALEWQLGMKREPRKGPAEMLIIDHAVRTPVIP